MLYVFEGAGYVLVTDDEPDEPHEPGLPVTTPGAGEGDCGDVDGAGR